MMEGGIFISKRQGMKYEEDETKSLKVYGETKRLNLN